MPRRPYISRLILDHRQAGSTYLVVNIFYRQVYQRYLSGREAHRSISFNSSRNGRRIFGKRYSIHGSVLVSIKAGDNTKRRTSSDGNINNRTHSTTCLGQITIFRTSTYLASERDFPMVYTGNNSHRYISR